MKNFKKWSLLALMLALVLTTALCLAACDKGDNPGGNKNPPVDDPAPVGKQTFVITVKDDTGSLVGGAKLNFYQGTELKGSATSGPTGIAIIELDKVDHTVKVDALEGYTAEESYTLSAASPAFTLTLKKQNLDPVFEIVLQSVNGPISGIKVQLCVDDACFLAKELTDAEGKTSIQVPSHLLQGTDKMVYISFPVHADMLAETYEMEEKYYFDASNQTLEITLPLRPDGSADRPFHFSGSTTSITLPADTTYYFRAFGIHGCNFSATGMNGGKLVLDAGSGAARTFEAEADGTLNCFLPANESMTANTPVTFTLSNPGTAEITVTFDITTLPGTYENPHLIENTADPVSVNITANGDNIYYEWVATATGTLTVTCNDQNSSITLNNLSANKYENPSDGAATTTVAVTIGDHVQIIVGSSTTAQENAALAFSFTLSVA